MEKLKKKLSKKKSLSRASAKSDYGDSTEFSILQDKVLAYCGYKLVGNKLVATGNYNPVPYQGL